MTREEMLRALAEGQDALEVTIKKWRDIVSGVGPDLGGKNCALCEEYADGPCRDCPIRILTERLWCRGTPYYQWRICIGASRWSVEDHYSEESLAEANKMLEFLESLRPPKMKDQK